MHYHEAYIAHISRTIFQKKSRTGFSHGFFSEEAPFTVLHTWHADAGELSNAVQASGVILAGHREAFVDVNLTSRACIPSTALTLEGALCVHTFSKMLARICTCR